MYSDLPLVHNHSEPGIASDSVLVVQYPIGLAYSGKRRLVGRRCVGRICGFQKWVPCPNACVLSLGIIDCAESSSYPLAASGSPSTQMTRFDGGSGNAAKKRLISTSV